MLQYPYGFLLATTNKDAMTPCFPAMTWRRLWLPKNLLPTLAPLFHPSLISSYFHIFLILQFCHWTYITSLVSHFYCSYINMDTRDTLVPIHAYAFISFISNNIHPILMSLQHQTHPFIKRASSLWTNTPFQTIILFQWLHLFIMEKHAFSNNHALSTTAPLQISQFNIISISYCFN